MFTVKIHVVISSIHAPYQNELLAILISCVLNHCTSIHCTVTCAVCACINMSIYCVRLPDASRARILGEETTRSRSTCQWIAKCQGNYILSYVHTYFFCLIAKRLSSLVFRSLRQAKENHAWNFINVNCWCWSQLKHNWTTSY